MIDTTMTGKHEFKLPKDLLNEATRVTKPHKEQLHVEGWRNSWLSRLSEVLIGKE